MKNTAEHGKRKAANHTGVVISYGELQHPSCLTVVKGGIEHWLKNKNPHAILALLVKMSPLFPEFTLSQKDRIDVLTPCA